MGAGRIGPPPFQANCMYSLQSHLGEMLGGQTIEKAETLELNAKETEDFACRVWRCRNKDELGLKVIPLPHQGSTVGNAHQPQTWWELLLQPCKIILSQ